MKKYLYYVPILFSFLIIISGCSQKTPITKRNQFIIISQEKEIALGESEYKKILNNSKLSNNKIATNKIKNIGRNIATAIHRDDYNWEFNLIQNNEKNAFCLPGGKVVIYTGILDIAKNDSQLATVISHEIAHALARHGAERSSVGMTSNFISNLGNIILSATVPALSGVLSNVISIGSTYGVLLPYGRMQENEADEIGIHIMYAAGYDIKESIKFWENMHKGKKKSQNSFFSTHPSSSQRIDNIKKIIQKINPKKNYL